jgi:hypothetical protein
MQHSERLDKLASELEEKGLPHLAEMVDTVTNTVDTGAAASLWHSLKSAFGKVKHALEAIDKAGALFIIDQMTGYKSVERFLEGHPISVGGFDVNDPQMAAHRDALIRFNEEDLQKILSSDMYTREVKAPLLELRGKILAWLAQAR